VITSVDFETYYDDECSVTELGVRNYVKHPKFTAYMVSIVREDGFKWVGDPLSLGCPWELINNDEWVSHNKSFDEEVFYEWVRPRLMSSGQLKKLVHPYKWHCTSQLAGYLGAGTSLSKASNVLLGLPMDKSIRDRMKGKIPTDLSPEAMKELEQYAMVDAERCLAIWVRYAPEWPELERRLADYSDSINRQGVCVDYERLEQAKIALRAARQEAEALIPWSPPLSLKKLAGACAEAGIPAPGSTRENSEEFDQWEERYGERFPHIEQVRRFRKSNRLLRIAEAMERRKIHSAVEGDKMPFELKYCGAHTGRWAGAGGVNMHNQPRGDFEGIDFRSMVIPDVNYSKAAREEFIIADYSQIEPRVLNHLCGNKAFLDMVREGYGVYEAHARATMGWKGGSLKDEAPKLYALAKARVLGLGYGCGAAKFRVVARAMAGLDLSMDEATRTVMEFRDSNPAITSYWGRMSAALEQRRNTGKPLIVNLPSGRKLYYRDIKQTSQGVQALIGGEMRKVYGGLIVENVTQAVARDVLGEALLSLSPVLFHMGARVVLHVHDEVVISCPKYQLPHALDRIKQAMTTPPEWLPSDFPLGVEIKTAPRYMK